MIDWNTFRQTVESGSEDARFSAFMEAYLSTDEVAQKELSLITQLHDPILKLLFLRFLSHVPESRAIDYICLMVGDDNAVVSEAAARSFERNYYEKKNSILLPLIHATQRRVQFFAIERLSEGGVLEVLSPLLTLLPTSDDELFLAVLTALRFLPHHNVIPVVMPYVSDARDEVRYRTILVVASLYESGFASLHKTLFSALTDPQARIRQSAVWALRRRLRKSDLQQLFKLSTEDPDSVVRQECLVELGSYPSSRVVDHLLNVLVTEKNKMVTLKCESVLLGLAPKQLLIGLNRVVQKGVGTSRYKAMLMAAEFQRGSPSYFQYLNAKLAACTDDSDRIPYLEALGLLGHPDAIPTMLRYIHQSSLVAYVAMTALLRLSSYVDDWPFMTYLEDPKGSDLLKQIIMQHLLRRNKILDRYVKRLNECLLFFLQSHNVNMRYLGTQVLIMIPGNLALGALLEMVHIETDPASLKLLETNFLSLFSRDPNTYVAMLLREIDREDGFTILSGLLQDIILGVDLFLDLLPKLLNSEIMDRRGDFLPVVICWAARYVLRGVVALDRVVEMISQTPYRQRSLELLVQAIEREPRLPLQVTISKLEFLLHTGSTVDQGAIVDLLGLSHNPKAIPALVGMLCDQKNKNFHAQAARALGRVAREQP